MIKDNLHFDAQPRLKKGIDKVAQAVGVTMGTGGSNAILEAIEYPGHMPTNDGYTIANAIMLADPIEDMGRKMLLEAINRANKSSGDGSSTTCVLTAAIINEGLKAMSLLDVKIEAEDGIDDRVEKLNAASKPHAMDVKRSIEACMPFIEQSLELQSRVIEIEDVGEVATISAEDPAIGERIREIYHQIGKSGLIYWDVSKTAEDTYTIGTGITVEGAGWVSPYMCDATESGQNTQQIRLVNPHIILTKQKISSANDFNDIGAFLFGKEVRDVVVFCDEIDPLVIPDIIKTRAVRGFRFAIVKMPILWKDWWYEDLAQATGATIIDPVAGVTFKNFLTTGQFGHVGNILITKDDTYLDGIKDVTKHIEELNALGTDEGAIRAARLNTKTARYFVGAASDSALSYRRFKVEDAISAAYQALNGGIVAGGGSALASITLPDTIGGHILSAAFKAPARQIATNAGHPGLQIGLDYDGVHGFDSKTQQFVDMFEAGITDPKNVVLNAVKNAVSVAAAVLTAPTIVTLPREERDVDPLSPSNSAVVHRM